MFEIDPSIGARGAAATNAFAARSSARLANQFEEAYLNWMAHAKKLERLLAEKNAEIERLELALAVEQSAALGHRAVVDAFKGQHANSPLLVEEGKLKNGSPRRRSTSIWIRAFDEAARKRGITNPEAHRIS